MHKFANITELLGVASQVVEAMKRLFPHISEAELKPVVLVYLLKNSTINLPPEGNSRHEGQRSATTTPLLLREQPTK